MGMISRNTTAIQQRPADVVEEIKAAVQALPNDERHGNNELKKPVLDLKTRQIQRQGIFQAVVSNPGLLSFAADLDAFKVVVRELTEYGIEFVNEGGK
jgi:hypothetical protein